jgi:hypothetical protein
VNDRAGDGAPLTIAQHQNVTIRSKRLIVCPYCDSSDVRPSRLLNPIEALRLFLLDHTAAENAGPVLENKLSISSTRCTGCGLFRHHRRSVDACKETGCDGPNSAHCSAHGYTQSMPAGEIRTEVFDALDYLESPQNGLSINFAGHWTATAKRGAGRISTRVGKHCEAN